jgi:hypothetical protein
LCLGKWGLPVIAHTCQGTRQVILSTLIRPLLTTGNPHLLGLLCLGKWGLPVIATAYSHNQREVHPSVDIIWMCDCVAVGVAVAVAVAVGVGGWAVRRAAGPVATMCFLPIFLEVLCIIFACLIRQGPPRVEMDKV